MRARTARRAWAAAALAAVLAIAGDAPPALTQEKLSFRTPPTLGKWIEGSLLAICSDAYEQRTREENWTREYDQAFFDSLARDRTPLADGSDEGRRMVDRLSRLGAATGSGLEQPDCSRLEHYFLQSPAYFEMARRVFDYYIVRPRQGGFDLAPVTNEGGSTNFVREDLLARVSKRDPSWVELFGGTLDSNQGEALKRNIQVKLSPSAAKP